MCFTNYLSLKSLSTVFFPSLWALDPVLELLQSVEEAYDPTLEWLHPAGVEEEAIEDRRKPTVVGIETR